MDSTGADSTQPTSLPSEAPPVAAKETSGGRRPDSFGQILRASLVVGSGSAVNVVLGIVKAKVLAVIMGPEGMGLLSMLQSVLNTANSITNTGLGQNGIQQVASARQEGNTHRLALLRRTMRFTGLLFALVASVVLISFRGPLADLALGNSSRGWMISGLVLGVVAASLATAETSWINGFRRIGDLTRVTAGTAIMSALLAIVAVAILRNDLSILITVIAYPLANAGIAFWYSQKIKVEATRGQSREDLQVMRDLVASTVALTLASAVGSATLLVARWLVGTELSLAAVGQFQAAWTISMVYLGFVFTAMGADYFPRLSEVYTDKAALAKLINDQAYVLLLLTGPLIMIMYVAAPLVVPLLYSREFLPSVSALRWQLLGDLFRVPLWTLSFVFLAQKKSVAYLLVTVAWGVAYVVALGLGLGPAGLTMTGIAFLIASLVQLAVGWGLVRRSIHMRWSSSNLKLLLINCVAAAILVGVQDRFPFYWLLQGLVAAALTAISLLTMRRSLGSWTQILKRLRRR